MCSISSGVFRDVVDAVGLKVDRLATTEQIIDPAAPAQGSGGSLLDKIGRFFKLDWFFKYSLIKDLVAVCVNAQ